MPTYAMSPHIWSTQIGDGSYFSSLASSLRALPWGKDCLVGLFVGGGGVLVGLAGLFVSGEVVFLLVGYGSGLMAWAARLWSSAIL